MRNVNRHWLKVVAIVALWSQLFVFPAPLLANSGWQTPALDAGMTGGIHTIYADRSGDGKIDVYTSAAIASQDDLFGASVGGARRSAYRIGVVLPVLSFLEIGLDVSGSKVSTRSLKSSGLSTPGQLAPDSISSFGDAKLRAKYYWRTGSAGFAAIAGYNLLQGVQNESTVGDVATPVIGGAFSYFGGPDQPVNGLRAHLNALYVYDRTINFLNSVRAASTFERFAWQMRDYTHIDAQASVEYAFQSLLTIAEYSVEIPLNKVAGRQDPIYRITPGLKLNPYGALTLGLAADFSFGGALAAAPAQPDYRVLFTAAYRFGGEIKKPTAPVQSTIQPTEATEQTEAPPEPASETTDLFGHASTENIDLNHVPGESDEPETEKPRASEDANKQSPTTDKPSAKPAAKKATKPKEGAVNLDQFSD